MPNARPAAAAHQSPPPGTDEALVEIAVAVVERACCYLIGQRGADAPLAGLWEFPGGKLRDGESARAAAARECLEETGLEIEVGELYAAVVHQYEHGRLRIHFFAGVPRDLDAAPLHGFRWVPAAQLERYNFPTANAAILPRLALHS
jgi:mutator protein MutT